MGHKHTKEEILDGALAAALDDGLSKLTFGRLAKRLGINDRTIVYYFPSKDALISDVLVAMGLGVQEMLAEAFTAPASDHITLVRAAWPVLQQPATEKIFALFFEANGLAASGIEPYRSLVTELVAAWIAWTADFIDGSDQHRGTSRSTTRRELSGQRYRKQPRRVYVCQRLAAGWGAAGTACASRQRFSIWKTSATMATAASTSARK